MLQFNSRHFEFNFIWHQLILIQFQFAAIELIQLACTHVTCHIARYDDAWSYLAFTALTWPWPHLPNPNPACDRLSGHPPVRTSAYSLIRLIANSLARLFAIPLVRLFACLPIRIFAYPPTRLFACSPIRLFAYSPIRLFA